MGRFYAAIFFTFLLMSRVAWSQTMDCEQTIAYATEEFNAGHFHSVPGILSDCMNSFSRDQKQRACLLLTQTYLLLDDPIGAQRSYLDILWANPEFAPDEQLHAIDIVYLSKRFTATPRFSWFVGAGSNVSPVRMILEIGTSPLEKESYTLRPGYNFGAGGEYSYNDNLRLRTEVNFFQTSYGLHGTGRHYMDEIRVVDRQTWLNIPLYICYSDNIGKYRPYGYAGFSISSLFTDKGAITLREIGDPGEEVEIVEVESADFDFAQRRNKMNQSIILGGGIKYKFGLDFLFAELRYSAGLKNVVNPEFIYGDPHTDATSAAWIQSSSPAFEYDHVDNYFRLDNLALTVGFLRPLYKPRELKRARTKSVLRKLKRAK